MKEENKIEAMIGKLNEVAPTNAEYKGKDSDGFQVITLTVFNRRSTLRYSSTKEAITKLAIYTYIIKEVGEMVKKKTSSKKKVKTKTKKKAKASSKNVDALKKVDHQCYFMVVDGSVIRSLYELAEALEWMSDDAYYYHVTQDRNDFCNWVNDIIKDTELAKKMGEAPNRERCQIIVLRHIIKKLL